MKHSLQSLRVEVRVSSTYKRCCVKRNWGKDLVLVSWKLDPFTVLQPCSEAYRGGFGLSWAVGNFSVKSEPGPETNQLQKSCFPELSLSIWAQLAYLHMTCKALERALEEKVGSGTDDMELPTHAGFLSKCCWSQSMVNHLYCWAGLVWFY